MCEAGHLICSTAEHSYYRKQWPVAFNFRFICVVLLKSFRAVRGFSRCNRHHTQRKPTFIVYFTLNGTKLTTWRPGVVMIKWGGGSFSYYFTKNWTPFGNRWHRPLLFIRKNADLRHFFIGSVHILLKMTSPQACIYSQLHAALQLLGFTTLQSSAVNLPTDKAPLSCFWCLIW